MKIARLLIFLKIFSLISCSSTPLPPEDKDRLSQITSSSDIPSNQADRWAYFALQTKGDDHQQACHAWRELYRDDFLLHSLVKAQILKCYEDNLSTGEFNQEIAKLIKDSPEWLNTQLTNLFLKSAKLNLENQVYLTLLKVEQLEVREEKVNFLLEFLDAWDQLAHDPSINAIKLRGQLEEKLNSLAPRFLEISDDRSLFEAARDFERIRDFQKARDLYEEYLKIPHITFTERLRAKERTARTYRLERRQSTFNQKTQEIAQFVESSYQDNPDDPEIQEVWFSRQERAIRSLWTQNQTKEARNQAQAFLSNHQGKLTNDQQAKLLMLKGLMSRELGQKVNTLHYLSHAYKKLEEDTELRTLVNWSFFWELYEQNIEDQAILLVKNLERTNISDSELARFTFWLAKIYQESHPEKASFYFQKTYHLSPLSYYGLLGLHYQDKKMPFVASTPPKESLIPEMEWLFFLDQKELARKYFKWAFNDQLADHHKKKYLHYFHRTEDYIQAIRSYHQVVDLTNEEQRNHYIAALYPSPWPKEVELAAREFQISKSLIYSIIRQESAFDANARSWADAFGLMQLIPERASELSRAFSIDFNHYTDLFNPQDNIRFGSALLSQLKSRFDGKFIFAVAAYNAGERPVDHWIKTRLRSTDQLLRFIEDIPYRETRQYVQHIIRNYLIYQSLHPNDEHRENLPL